MNRILSRLGVTSLMMTGALTFGAVAFTTSPVASVAAALPSDCTYNGVWGAKGSNIEMKVYESSDGEVSARYDDGAGHVTGKVFKTKTYMSLGGTFTYQHSDQYGRTTHVSTGDFVFIMDTSDCYSWRGYWRYRGEKEWRKGWDHYKIRPKYRR